MTKKATYFTDSEWSITIKKRVAKIALSVQKLKTTLQFTSDTLR